MRKKRIPGDAAGLDGGSQELLVVIVDGRVIGGQKRDAHRVQSGFHRHAQVHCARLEKGGAGRHGLVPVEQAGALAVDQDFEFFAGHVAERAAVPHVAALHRGHLEGVLAVGGELMAREQSAARAERQPLDVVVLRGVLGHLIHRLARRRYVAHRQAADLSRRRHVGLEQRRRQPQRARQIVEAVARIVGRQGLGGVHL